MYKEDLALNNLQWLIGHKTLPNYFILMMTILQPIWFVLLVLVIVWWVVLFIWYGNIYIYIYDFMCINIYMNEDKQNGKNVYRYIGNNN